MPRLARLVEQHISQDIITGGPKILLDNEAEPEAEKASGPVKTTLDLSQFIKFDSLTSKSQFGKWIGVNQREIVISYEISKNLPPESKVEFYLNRKGTILVLKTSLNGLPVRSESKGKTKCVSCKALIDTLLKMGLQLPVRYIAEWDEDLQAWVGRHKRED
jgi:hypothetical protein